MTSVLDTVSPDSTTVETVVSDIVDAVTVVANILDSDTVVSNSVSTTTVSLIPISSATVPSDYVNTDTAANEKGKNSRLAVYWKGRIWSIEKIDQLMNSYCRDGVDERRVSCPLVNHFALSHSLSLSHPHYVSLSLSTPH